MNGLLSKILTVDTSDPSRWQEHDAEVEAFEKKEAAENKQKRYEESTPRRYWNESLDTYKTDTPEQAKALALVRRYVEKIKGGDAGNLALIGRAGAGKTHLSCGALRECGGKYYAASELAERMHRAHGFSTKETEAEILAECTDCPLLVIDEIGRGANAQDEKYAIYQIMNERYNERRGTVLISNFDTNTFYNYIGDAVVDRFIECGYVFEFKTTQSYRQQLRNKGGIL